MLLPPLNLEGVSFCYYKTLEQKSLLAFLSHSKLKKSLRHNDFFHCKEKKTRNFLFFFSLILTPTPVTFVLDLYLYLILYLILYLYLFLFLAFHLLSFCFRFAFVLLSICFQFA